MTISDDDQVDHNDDTAMASFWPLRPHILCLGHDLTFGLRYSASHIEGVAQKQQYMLHVFKLL